MSAKVNCFMFEHDLRYVKFAKYSGRRKWMHARHCSPATFGQLFGTFLPVRGFYETAAHSGEEPKTQNMPKQTKQVKKKTQLSRSKANQHIRNMPF